MPGSGSKQSRTPSAAAEPWHVEAVVGAAVLVRGARGQEPDALLAADLGVGTAAFALADTGALVILASSVEHRLDSLVPPVHIALLRASTIVSGLGAALERLRTESRFVRHSAVTFIRGPSRTADIELTLTVGVHGPGRVYCVVLDDAGRH